MKILLINPITYTSINDFIQDSRKYKINADEPIGIMYISSYLKQHGYDCEVYDWHIECCKWAQEHIIMNGKTDIDRFIIDKMLELKIKEYNPDIVGISALYEFNSQISLEVAEIVKNIDKNIITVMGGIYASILETPPKNVDYLIKGEGEEKFLNLLKYLNKEQSFHESIYKNIDILDINKNPHPERSTILVGEYSVYGRQMTDRFYKENARTATIQTDRGCPFHCTYCSGHLITQRNFRKRNIDNIVKEIEYLQAEHNIEVFIFNSENAVVDKKWTKELYRELIKFDIRWIHNGGFYVHLMDEELVKLAIDSGLIMFNLAIESGSKEILRKVSKSPKIVDHAPKVVEWIRKYSKDIYVTAFFLSGFPFETWEDVERSKQLVRKLDINWLFWNQFVPFRGSELYDYCIKYNHIEKNIENNNIHYISSNLKNCKIDMEKLSNDIYEFQIEYNFKNNRSFRNLDYKQAMRDAKHVLNITNNQHKEALILYKNCIRKINEKKM